MGRVERVARADEAASRLRARYRLAVVEAVSAYVLDEDPRLILGAKRGKSDGILVRSRATAAARSVAPPTIHDHDDVRAAATRDTLAGFAIR